MAQSVFANQRPRYLKSDDPLADLAAITGYRGEESARSADDFAIDLERELMSAFGGEEVAENVIDEALDADLEAGFDRELSASEYSAGEDEDFDDDAFVADAANSNDYAVEAHWAPEGTEYAAPVAAAEPQYAEPASEEHSTEAFVDMDFGDFDPADFHVAYEEAPVESAPAVVEAVDDFESQLLAEIDARPQPVQYAEPAVAAGGMDDFEAELGAALTVPPAAAPVPAAPEAVAAPADPFAELATLAAGFRTARPSAFSRAPSWTLKREEPAAPAAPFAPLVEQYVDPAPAHEPVEAGFDAGFAALEEVDEGVPVTDDFELPETIYEDEAAPDAYSDIDVEFPEPYVAADQQAKVEPDAFDGIEADLTDFFAAELARQTGSIEAEAPVSRADYVPQANYAEAYRQDESIDAPSLRLGQPRRGLWVAAGVAAVALLGGVAAFAFMGGSSTSSEPALVKADTGPIKVKPENPGGAQIANQDKAVYDKVAGAEAAAKPEQPKLVTTAEEPVDVNAAAAERAPAVKAEDRVAPDQAPAEEQSAIAAVQPRKVRTLIVKPDGTLVAPEEAAQAAAPVAGAEPAVTYQPPSAPVQDAAATPAEMAAPKLASAEPVAEDPVKAAIADEAPATPTEKPVLAKKPVEKAKPVEAKAKPAEKVAAAVAEPAAATGGDWSIQIASQPSKDGAQASYKALSGKFGSIIGGRGVSIVQAEIPGKGTFYRVRIPAGSKSDANSLCARYQAAGGSCFITR